MTAGIRLTLAVTLAGLFLHVETPPATAADWPQSGGPEANGTSPETGWNTDWSARPPKRLWKAEVGKGYGAPAVVDGRVYVLAEAEQPPVHTMLRCLDADTGKVLWTSKPLLGKAWQASVGTPAVDSSRAFVFGTGGFLHCVDARGGQVLWKRVLRNSRDPAWPNTPYTVPPLLYRDWVLLNMGFLLAVGKTDGKVEWAGRPERCRLQRGAGGMPQVLQWNGSPFVAAPNAEGIFVYRVPGGGEVAHLTGPSFRKSKTTLAHGDRLIAKRGPQTIGCFRLQGTRLVSVWSGDDLVMDRWVLVAGHLYGVDRDRGELKCAAFDTGRLAWSERVIESRARGPHIDGLIAAGDHLLLTLSDDSLLLVKASPSGYQEGETRRSGET